MFLQAVKRHLRAKTPKALERAMIMNNIQTNTWHDYQIVFDGKNWYAWYLRDSNVLEEVVKE